MKTILKQRFLMISFFASCVLTASCSKDKDTVKKPATDDEHEPIGKVSYIADGVFKSHEIFDQDPYDFRKGLEYSSGSDTPIYNYTSYLPFSSPKTKDGMQFYIGNDSLIIGQKYTKRNLVLNPAIDRHNANSLAVLVETDEDRYQDNWYHGDLDFQLIIDSIVNKHAFGHFDGNLLYYQLDEHGLPTVATDTIKIESGLFYNIPIIDSF